MKINLQTLSIWLALFISSLGAQEDFFPDDTSAMDSPCLKEITFVISPQDLIFDQEDISINWNGNIYPLSSLKKEENQWVAKITPFNNYYCPRGHPRCSKCNLCHLKGCGYYVPPCWK